MEILKRYLNIGLIGVILQDIENKKCHICNGKLCFEIIDGQ